MLRLLLLLVLLAPVTMTQACVCRKTTLERQLTRSTAAFVAEVQAAQTTQSPARLSVVMAIKGNLAAGSHVDVETQFGDCSATDVPGTKLLVFLDDFAGDRRTISACSSFLIEAARIGTVRLEPEPEVLEFLRTTAKAYIEKKKTRTR